jgi:hypothetical protein
MKKTKRIIMSDFPSGSLDRNELRRVFGELREKRLARARRGESIPGTDPVSVVSTDRDHASTLRGAREQNRAT